jgi:hypothetical protein
MRRHKEPPIEIHSLAFENKLEVVYVHFLGILIAIATMRIASLATGSCRVSTIATFIFRFCGGGNGSSSGKTTMTDPSSSNSHLHHYHHNNNNHNDPMIHPSPSHLAMTGHEFSAEDIQDLLGSVLEDGPAPGSSEDSMGEISGRPILKNDVDAKVAARTERKRSREKQRRSDVNKQFGELSKVLRQIDAHTSGDASLYAPGNRAELIARTVRLLETMDECNKKQKREIEDLQVQLENSKKAGEEMAAKLKEQLMAPRDLGHNRVMMMVPMMIHPNGGPPEIMATAAAMSSNTTTSTMTPWMMPYAPDPQPQPPRSASAPPPPPTAAATTATMAPWMMPFLPPPFVAAAAAPTSAIQSSDAPEDSLQQRKPASNNTSGTSSSNNKESASTSSSSSPDSTDSNAKNNNSTTTGSNLAHCA